MEWSLNWHYLDSFPRFQGQSSVSQTRTLCARAGHVKTQRLSYKADAQLLLNNVKHHCAKNNNIPCILNVYHVSNTLLKILHILFQIFLKTTLWLGAISRWKSRAITLNPSLSLTHAVGFYVPLPSEQSLSLLNSSSPFYSHCHHLRLVMWSHLYHYHSLIPCLSLL